MPTVKSLFTESNRTVFNLCSAAIILNIKKIHCRMHVHSVVGTDQLLIIKSNENNLNVSYTKF